ncbi:MAG: hypothetical protein F4Z86_12625 [Gemmatimonadetes bacterium]|nr:hypothetical protein [Gemmatimonadota bacterium]MYB58673.1 hypothetical protein [Gemmatimonadota bacterium]
MSEYPFNLQGTQERFSGSGRKDGETTKSREFNLTQGVVIAEIKHHGYDNFKLSFIPTEGFSEGAVTAVTYGSSAATGFATGAAIGSFIPFAGTIAGALIGGAAGYFAGTKAGEAIAPTVWTPVDYKGKLDTFAIIGVKEDQENSLPPGKYLLEVETKSRWDCCFIQPTLGQSFGSLTDDDDENDVEAGLYVRGPLMSGSRPLRTTIRHMGGGDFFAAAYSVDGTHQCLVYHYEEGQFHIEDHPTEIKPGKEYMLYISAGGAWNLNFTEGY